jgi:hypothetical protein
MLNLLVNKTGKEMVYKVIDALSQNRKKFIKLTDSKYIEFIGSILACFREYEKYYTGCTKKHKMFSYFDISRFFENNEQHKNMWNFYKYN